MRAVRDHRERSRSDEPPPGCPSTGVLLATVRATRGFDAAEVAAAKLGRSDSGWSLVMHWKLRRDPYLEPLCRKHGEEAAWAAGFFMDDDPDDAPLDDVDWLCTPRPKRPVSRDRPVVLLATGGFCPVHAGHVEMMDRAREAAERAGFDVVGGYLSPGHDAYLRMKCGPLAIAAQVRLRLCADAVAHSDWLSVDPWEAMHRRVAVNFTDVTARLEAYLRAHVDERMEVITSVGPTTLASR